MPSTEKLETFPPAGLSIEWRYEDNIPVEDYYDDPSPLDSENPRK